MASFNINSLTSYSSLFSTSSYSSNYSTLNKSTSNLNYSVLSDYASIKSGNYKKLLRSYYAKKADEEDTQTDNSTGTLLKNMSLSSESLKSISASLMSVGDDSIFNQKEVSNEETNTTTLEYDKDTIAKKISSFVDSYNQVVESLGDQENTSILNKGLNMVNYTKANSKLLSDIGITINSDNTLSLDEEKLKSSNVTNIKSVFQGSYSYGYTINKKVSGIYHLANSTMTSYISKHGSSGVNYDYSV